MALYQAAVSKAEISNSSTNAVEEAEAYRIPGGLASVKNQFEKAETSSTQSAQYQYQHKSIQKMSSQSQVKMSSSSTETQVNEVTSRETQQEAFQLEKVSHQEQASTEVKKTSNVTESADKIVVNAAVNEESPKISAQSLKQHFEKPAQGKTLPSGRESGTPAKQIKIGNECQEMIWPSSAVSSAAAVATSRQQEAYMVRKTKHASAASTAACCTSSKYGSTEEFPPPPSPDLLQAPTEMTEFSQSPEPSPSPSKQPFPKDFYSKQRNIYELKRLYKHIHPELRKNLEKDYFNDISEIVSSSNTETGTSLAGDVRQARYIFENSESSPQKCMSPEREYLEWDEILKGEVQSMRWIFENQPLDSIRDESPDPSDVKSIGDQEIIAGGDVKYTTWMFETQPMDSLGAHTSESPENADGVPELACGDVRTATWMFETQPLDSMNKIHHEKEEDSDESCCKEITGGDVKTVKYMFETQHLDSLGQLYSVDETKLLQLRSELKEIKGDVKRSIRHFETLPMYVIRNNLGQMLEIKTVQREDLEKGDVRTVRWMFETQPLDMINKDSLEIKVVCGISMEESIKGEVGRAKWLFETQPLDTIKEEYEETVVEKEAILGTDVCKKCWLFETQPLDTLKESEDGNPLPSEEIIGGDVNTTKHLFETLPMDMLKDSPDVGKLQKMAATEEEKGDVRHQKWIFETKPLEQIREEQKEIVRAVKLEEIDKGDVSSCRHVFETCHLRKQDDSYKIHVEGVTQGAVKLNKAVFETTPLYAIQDRLGKYHKVKTIRQEEIIRGDVRNCRWLFETRPIDQFDESIEKIEIIKGISSQEVQSGDVKTAKWLFETQPLDSIKYFAQMEDEESTEESQATEVVKGDVKTCRWLFETQPMETLYDKETIESDNEEIHKGDVKTCTWLFETRPLDAIGEDSETAIKLHTVEQEEIQGSDVRTACFLFETENLENIQGEEGKEIKRVVEIDIQPGDVSTMKYKFENQSLDSINSSSEEVLRKIKNLQYEDVQKGDVLRCCWLFENQSLDEIAEHEEDRTLVKTVTDIQGGNVRKGCFIFETFSLDQIKDESSTDISTIKTVSEDEITKGDVKSYRMLFETQPLYAIQDREGYYHEVTTVKKEEVIHGDVRGTRWLFETKPLGSINKSDNVYVIKSVTQEDIQKGDVNSVRYRFETQPLDTISDEERIIVPTVDSVQGGDVKANKKLFESEEAQEGMYVRTVSVSEIQHGNVKTSTWLFETHTIDEIRGEESEYKDVKTVTKEEVQEGDVQHSVWLFENQPLDSIKETDESDGKIDKEEIPQADVKTTTWLFETTPFHEFNESHVEKEEIIGKSVKKTLKELYSHKVVETHGIILESDEIGDVRMAKYKLMNQEAPEIQKEEIIKGDLANIILNLLSRPSTEEKENKVNEDEKGNVNLTKQQLLNRSTGVQIEKEEVVRGDIQQAIKNLFSKDSSVKHGILIQENERGDINMTVYSLFHKKDGNNIKQDEIIGGDVKRTIHSLLSSAMNNEILERPKIDDSERGNVQFFTTCIEAGALDYLKLLQTGTNETFSTRNQEEEEEEEEIIGGDVEGTKLLLKKKKSEIQRTVNEADIVPGDVCNAVKIFMTEPQNTSCHVCKEEIIKGDLKAALNSLSQAINQTTVAEKEEIIKADILAILQSLKESAYHLKETEKPDVIPGDIKQAIESLEKARDTKNEILKQEVVQSDLESTLRSLKAAQQSFKTVALAEIDGRESQTMVGNLLEASAERKILQHQAVTSSNIKQINESLFKPSQQLVNHEVNVIDSLQNNIKSPKKHHAGMKSEKESLLTEDTRAIHLNQKQSTKAHEADKKNVKGLSSSQYKVMEKGDKSISKVRDHNIAKGEAKCHTDQYMSDQSAFCGNVQKKERIEKSEASSMMRKDSSSNVVQSTKQFTGKKYNVFHEHKDDKHFDTNLQERTKGKSTLSTCDHSSDHKEARELVNMSTCKISKVAGHVRTQEEQHSRKQSQHSNEVCKEKKNNVKASQAEVSMASEQNIKTNQKVRTTQEMHTQIKEAERKQTCNVIQQSEKSMLRFRGKAKVEGAESDFKVMVKNPLNLNKNPKGPDRSEIDSPPPPPPPPSPPISVTSSDADLPLPPPPPPLTHLMTASDRQSFPSPPPPIGQDKMESEHFPPPPPPVKVKGESELAYAPSPSLLPHPSAIPQPKQKRDHFLKHLDKTLQTSIQHHDSLKGSRGSYIKSHTQIEPAKDLETNPRTSRKIQPNIVQIHTQSDTMKTMEEKTESIMMRKTVNNEKKEENVYTKTEEIRRPSSVTEATKLKTSPITRTTTFPLVRSPSLPAEATQMKPKLYVRKFKTPLMIAEEKYRQQREEMEQKEVRDVCPLAVRLNSETWGSSAQNELETCHSSLKLEEVHQTPLQGPLLSAALEMHTEPECQGKAQVGKPQVHERQPMPKVAAANQSQISAEENSTTKAVHSSQNLNKQCESSQMVEAHRECTVHKRQQCQNEEQLHLSKTKIMSPTFKVRTIKFSPLDQSLHEIHMDSMMHKNQEGTSIQKQHIKEKQKENVSKATIKKENSAKSSSHVNVDEKMCPEKPILKYTKRKEEGKDKESSEVKQRLVQRQEIEKDKIKQERVSSVMEGKQSQVIGFPKEKKVSAQRQQVEVSNKSEKMVKQKIIDMFQDSQTLTSEQGKTHVSETNIQNKKLSQQNSDINHMECTRENINQHKKVLLKTTEPKQDFMQKKPLSFSSPRGSPQSNEKNSVDILEFLRKREEVQQVLSRVKEFEIEPNKNGIKTFQAFLNVIPEWLIEQEKKESLTYIAQENNVEKMKEELLIVKEQATKMLESCEDAIQTAMISMKPLKSRKGPLQFGEQSQKATKVSLGSSMKDSQKTKEINKDIMAHQEVKQIISARRLSEIGMTSPSLRTRAPSPTYITIESRCIEPSHREIISPVQRESTPVPPSPPPRNVTPTFKTQPQPAACPSPSPPRSRSEQLAKLKDTTVKLSQGATQNRSVTPIPILEKRSEIVKSPATLRRQIKIDTRQTDVLSSKMSSVNESHVTASTVKKIKEAHEESETNKMHISQKRGNIPESLEPHIHNVGSICITQKFEVPKADSKGLMHKFEASEQMIHIRKEPEVPEKLNNESEDKIDIVVGMFNDKPKTEVISQKRYVENGISHGQMKEERHRFSKNGCGQTSQEPEKQKEHFQKSPRRRQREPKENKTCKQKECVIQEHSLEPTVCFDTKSHNELSSGMDSFENTVVASRAAISTSRSTDGMQSGGFGFKRAPPTYEDVISGHILDISAADSPEELLRNFQKTWQESEQVFKSLGYNISEAAEAEVRSSFHEEAEFISETATSGKGSVPTLSKESLSNGVPGCRQADLS